MIINIKLSDVGIRNAISKLEQAKENLHEGIRETVEMMVIEGAEIAQSADGGMATVSGNLVTDTTGVISAVGETNVIAEFGAGDTTLDPSGLFENNPDTPVFPGSYSLLEGTQEYYATGKWHFGSNEYTFVEAKQGMYKAKEHIENNFAETLVEVVEL